MAFRNLPLLWLSGSSIVLGYAAFSWLRAKRTEHERPEPELGQRHEALQPLSACLEHVPVALALETKAEPLPTNDHALPRTADLGALFLGRASQALSPFHFLPRWPQVRR